MNISPDLKYALLALDSYNRGYGAGIGDSPNGLGETGEFAGGTILNREQFGIDSKKLDEWGEAGFFAVADKIDGQTIISYRGTDVFNDDNIPDVGASDVVNGWFAAINPNGTNRALPDSALTGFSASEYSLSGQAVIAFRDTNFLSSPSPSAMGLPRGRDLRAG